MAGRGADHPATCVGDLTDDRRVELPLLANRDDARLLAGLRDEEHPLLGLAQEHLVRGELLRATRHAIEVEIKPAAAPARHLDGRRGEPRRAHVLDADEEILGEYLEASFEE